METNNKKSKGSTRMEMIENEVMKRDIEAVMFIPHTKNSELQRRLQKVDNDYIANTKQKRFKFVERGGQTFEQILSRSDALGKHGCTRSTCF